MFMSLIFAGTKTRNTGTPRNTGTAEKPQNTELKLMVLVLFFY